MKGMRAVVAAAVAMLAGPAVVKATWQWVAPGVTMSGLSEARAKMLAEHRGGVAWEVAR